MAIRAQKTAKPKNGNGARPARKLQLVKSEEVPTRSPTKAIEGEMIEALHALDLAREDFCVILSVLKDDNLKGSAVDSEFLLEMLLSMNKHIVAINFACNSARRHAQDGAL